MWMGHIVLPMSVRHSVRTYVRPMVSILVKVEVNIKLHIPFICYWLGLCINWVYILKNWRKKCFLWNFLIRLKSQGKSFVEIHIGHSPMSACCCSFPLLGVVLSSRDQSVGLIYDEIDWFGLNKGGWWLIEHLSCFIDHKVIRCVIYYFDCLQLFYLLGFTL